MTNKLFEPVEVDGFKFYPLGYITRDDIEDNLAVDTTGLDDSEMSDLAKSFGEALQESFAYEDVLEVIVEDLPKKAD